MKHRHTFLFMSLVAALLILINVILTYSDERLENRERELATKKEHFLLLENELVAGINETDEQFFRAYVLHIPAAADTVNYIHRWHLGQAPRPNYPIYPNKLQSHKTLLTLNATSEDQKIRISRALHAYDAYITWVINNIEQGKTVSTQAGRTVPSSALKKTAQQEISAMLNFAVGEMRQQQADLKHKSHQLTIITRIAIVGSVGFFFLFILVIFIFILKPFYKNKKELADIDHKVWRAANVVFWEFDLHKKSYKGGRSFAQFFGYDADSYEIPYDSMKSMLQPHEWDNLRETIHKSLSEKRKKEAFEFGFQDSNGNRRYVKALSEYQYNEKGEILRRHGIMQDITRQKLTEKELEINRDRLNDTLHQLEIGMAEVSPLKGENRITDITFLNINEAFCNICNLNYEDIVGKSFYDVFPETSTSFFRFLISKFDDETKTLNVNINYPFQGKWVNIKSYRPIANKLLVFVEDITHDMLMKQTLRHNQERLTLSEQMARLGYCEIDLTEMMLFGNRIAYEIHGINREGQMTIDSFKSMILPEDHTIVDETFERIKHTDRVEMVYRVQLQNKLQYIQCVLEATVEGKRNYGAFGFVHDITEVKLAELKLRKAMEKAKESERLKSAFLANMSHEIRTPLSAIVGFAGIIAKNKNITEQEREECNTLIEKNSNTLMYLINDIVELSKIESGEVAIMPTNVELNSFLDDTYEVFSSEIARKGQKHLRLFLNKTIETDFTIQVDSYRLSQIVNNLVSNAIKFTSKGFVEIGYEIQDTEKLVMYVRDSGIGIDKENQDLIFDVFRQEDLKIAGKFGGTGLGLAISKKLTNMMGGEIWVDSVKGVGSTFFFTLPLNKPATQPHIEMLEQEISVQNIPNLENKLILVADDEEFIHILFKKYLQQTGATIVSAFNGEEVLSLMDKGLKVDLLLLDMRMPKLNGLETLKQIRSNNTALPIIAQTAYAFVGDRERFIKAGCNDYLAKPTEENELLNMLGKYLS